MPPMGLLERSMEGKCTENSTLQGAGGCPISQYEWSKDRVKCSLREHASRKCWQWTGPDFGDGVTEMEPSPMIACQGNWSGQSVLRTKIFLQFLIQANYITPYPIYNDNLFRSKQGVWKREYKLVILENMRQIRIVSWWLGDLRHYINSKRIKPKVHLLVCMKVSTRLIDDLAFWPSDEKRAKISRKESSGYWQ